MSSILSMLLGKKSKEGKEKSLDQVKDSAERVKESTRELTAKINEICQDPYPAEVFFRRIKRNAPKLRREIERREREQCH